MSEKYKDTNLNYYIKVRLTDDGIRRYKEYYSDYGSDAPGIDIDDEGYVEFQIYDFMHIFGKRLFMGAALPCATNCKIQVKDEWHNLEKNPTDLPKENMKQVIVKLSDGSYEMGYYCIHNNSWWANDCPDYDDELRYYDYNTGENIYPIKWKEII